MSLPDYIAVQKYHRDRIVKFGVDSSWALGWTSEEGQLSRFKIIEELLGDLSEKSVLDVGCGHGDLRGFFGNKFDGLRYAGIDQIDSFLDVAIERYGNYPDTAFYFGDFFKAELPVMDYMVACGALSYWSSDPDYVFKAITKLYNNCRLGVVFNLLKHIDSEEKILTGYDPEIILAHCKTLSENVIYKDGYYGEDYSIFLKK
jgi:SAM-dependent methyltransferase